MLPMLTVVGLVVTVVLTLAAVWYASRRLRQLEAKLKLGNGLTATHIKDMDKVVADISEVKQGLHSLAHEMGLKFVSPERVQHQTAQRQKPPVEQPRAAPQQSHKRQQEAAKSLSQKEATTPSQKEATIQSPPEATKSPSQQEATTPSQQEATKSLSQQEATKSPSQQEAKIQSPPEATKSPSQQPPTARKGKGKGKSTILMNLFPEFVGPITIPTETTTSSTHVPRVEEMGEDTECEGGMCTINSK